MVKWITCYLQASAIKLKLIKFSVACTDYATFTKDIIQFFLIHFSVSH